MFFHIAEKQEKEKKRQAAETKEKNGNITAISQQRTIQDTADVLTEQFSFQSMAQ